MPWPCSVLHRKYSSDNPRSGFGLIELMVSVSIMVIVAGIILARQNSFNGAVLLRSQAYEIAFEIREVQIGAVSSGNVTGGDVFRSVLGVNFSTASDRYVSFRDSNGNNQYDPGTDPSLGQQGVIDSRFYITRIEIDGVPHTESSVLFVRPNFDAIFSPSGSEMLIYLKRKGSQVSDIGPGDLRIIEVTSTGQIDVR
jgi:prepilin-type N-terminal cleavage/methylation domain-containing protein